MARRRTSAAVGVVAAAAMAGVGLAPVAEAAPATPSIAVTACANGGITTISWTKLKVQTLSVTWVRTDGVREIHDLTSALNTKKPNGTMSYQTPATSTETWATYSTDTNATLTDTAHLACQ